MKLLIYSHFFAPSIGGVENIVLSLARGLAELRDSNGVSQFEVTLFTETQAGNNDDAALPFRVVRRAGLIQLWQLIRSSDVVHVAGPALAPLFLSFIGRKTLVIEHHGYQAICPNGVMVYQPDRTVCPGHFQAGRYGNCLRCQKCQTSAIRSLASLLLMFPRHWLSCKAAINIAIARHGLERHALPRSSVIYYGIEDPFGQDMGSPPALDTPGGVCFAFVGRFVPEKGIPILLQAAKILKEEGYQFEVLLIGDGPQRARLEATISSAQLKNCVRITGYLTGPALTNALREVRVVVMPSIWEETAGLAAIEQMMRGRLVIASDIGGLCEIVGDAGLKSLPGNADSLAECMRRVLRDASLIDSLGGKARDRSLRLFARGRMIDEHARVYHQVFRRRLGQVSSE